MQAAALGDATLFWIWTILTSVHFFAFFLAVADKSFIWNRCLLVAVCVFAYSPLRGIICNTFLS